MDCTISGNSAWSGAGIYCEGAAATMTNCDIAQNTCTLSSLETSWGGGVCIVGCSPTVEDCRISNNSAWSGAGIYCGSGSAPLIKGCAIAGNMGQDDSDQYSYGGGLDCDESSPTVQNCDLERNSAYSGAGVCLSVSGGSIENCRVADNVGTPDALGESWGGGMGLWESSTSIESCTISGNSAYAGAGIRCKGTPSCGIVE